MIDKLDMLRAQDRLPVSEEMIGAYLEGNLTPEEVGYVERMMRDNDYLTELLNEVIDSDLENDDLDERDFSLDYDDFEVPAINEDDAERMMTDAYFGEEETETDMFGDDDMNQQTLNDNKMDDNSKKLAATEVIGEPGEHDRNQVFMEILQNTDSTCAVRSQEIILRDYGIYLSEDQLAEFAEQQGWYAPGEGTPPEAMGLLLEACGVECKMTTGNTIYDLINELSQGHRVMVAVDSGELWAETFGEEAREWFDDLMHGDTQADHALIVAGVEVNPDDPDDVKVVITDPGTGNLRVEYPIDEFMDAWKDSNCQMAATTQPAPYQYNEQTGMMEPSNFVTEFELNKFVQEHSIALPSESFNIPDGYQAHYADGHLDELGPVSYGEFQLAYGNVTTADKSEFQRAWEFLRDLFFDDDKKEEFSKNVPVEDEKEKDEMKDKTDKHENPLEELKGKTTEESDERTDDDEKKNDNPHEEDEEDSSDDNHDDDDDDDDDDLM